MSYKTDLFKNELIYIKDSKIREFVETVLENLPDYFFIVPASSTGKYHPSYSLGEGGLVRHIRSCIRIAVELFRLDMFNYFDKFEKDLILASLFIHDGYKNGKENTNFTVTNHPKIMGEEIRSNPIFLNMLEKEVLEIIAGNVEHHMGQWVFDYKTNKQVLEKPDGKMQNFVHLVDYLASRRCLEMNFDVELSKD